MCVSFFKMVMIKSYIYIICRLSQHYFNYEEESEDGKTMSYPFFKKWLMDPNQRIYRNHREKNKDKLASYMTNYMEGCYDDRKDKFYEYKKVVKKNS